MKKCSHGIIAMIIVVCFIVVSCVPVSADSNFEPAVTTETTRINEYEEITALQKNTAEELQEMGYSASEAEEILEFSYRDALLERASLPESTLQARGYDEDQIAFMKEFANDPDGDYDFSVMSVTLKTRKFTLVAGANSSKTKTVKYTWEWSAMPLMAYNDKVAVRWQAYNSKGLSVDSTVNKGSANRSCKVYYYSDSGGIAKTENVNVTYKEEYNCLHTDGFAMSQIYKGDTVWAKSGYVVFKMEIESSAGSMEYMKVQATYGHKTFLGGMSLTFKGILGVAFEGSCTNYYRNAQIKSSVKYLD